MPLLFALCFSAIPGFDIPLEGGTRGNHTQNQRPATVRDVNIEAYVFSRRSGGMKVNKRMVTLHKSNTTLPHPNKVSILSSLTLINPNKSDGDGLFFFSEVPTANHLPPSELLNPRHPSSLSQTSSFTASVNLFLAPPLPSDLLLATSNLYLQNIKYSPSLLFFTFNFSLPGIVFVTPHARAMFLHLLRPARTHTFSPHIPSTLSVTPYSNSCSAP